MIDLPVGKALIAVHSSKQCKQECRNEDYKCPNYKDCCKGCELDINELGGSPDNDVCACLCCIPDERRDEKHVVYKLVDYQEGNHPPLM